MNERCAGSSVKDSGKQGAAMRSRTIWMTSTAVAVWCLGSGIVGCSQVKDTEQLLSAAGFQMKLADTPERMSNLANMAQHKVVAHKRGDKIVYVYADAKECKCMYLGDQAAYQEYQRLAVEKEIADENVDAAEANEDAAADWDSWGGFRE